MDIQADKPNNNQSDIDSDPNALQRIGTELKSTIFAMVSLLLKEQEVSVYFAAFIPIFEFLQVMGYAFHKRVYLVWDFDDIAKVLHDILEHIRLFPYLEETSMSVYSIIFYLILGILLFLMLGLAYIYYISSRRRPAFSWPVQAIRIILAFLSGILFLPVCEYILSVFACVKTSSGALVHSVFTETRCWEKVHLANGIFAIFGSLVFLIITGVTTLIFFEARPIANNLNARKDSRALLLFNIYKVCLVLLFTFLTDRDYQVAQIAFLLIGSTVIFVKFQFQNPFYNEIIMKAWSTMAAINLWTALMLVFAKIMENSKFRETIFVWMLVIPLVIFVNLNNTDKRISYFLINTNKFQAGVEVINHISYLLKLLSIQNTNKNAATMLDGYLEIHKQDCFNEQCPCRNKNKVINNNRITRNLLIGDDNLSEKEAIIIYLIYQIYVQGTKSFPNNTPLRIAYAFFLLDKMSSKQQALQILSEAEQRHPPLDQEFIVFRYKKIIEDEIAESQHDHQVDGGLDVGSESSFQNHLRLCQANIEKSALLHMEFWSQLSEDQPDLAKVGEIGAKISASIKAVEDQWNKLAKINPNNAKAMRLFGKFLIEIIHNKERGEDLLDRASNLANIGNNKKNVGFMAGNKDFGDEALPTIVISGEQDRFGVITSINLAAASLFSFNKNELLNRKLSTLMPPLYAKHHDNFLERYLQTNESTVIGKNKGRLAFGKTKSNYAFPFFYNVKAIPSMMQGVQFVATLRIEKKLKNTAYVITYPDGTIDSISSSCISLLKIDKSILQKRPKIQDYIPNILSDRHVLFTSTANGTKASATINFAYPEDSEYLLEDEEPSAQLSCHLYDLVFHNGRENAGFQFRFEKTADRISTHSIATAKISNFQFRLDRQKMLFLGEYVNEFGNSGGDTPEYNEVLNVINSPSGVEMEPSSATGLVMSKSAATGVKGNNTEDDGFNLVRKTEYGIGIKTYRLFKGEVTDIEDDKSEENEEDEERDSFSGQKRGTMVKGSSGAVNNANSEDNLEEEGSTADFGNAVKSRKVLTSVINDRTPPVNVKRLNAAIHVLALVLIALSIWDYVNLLNKMDELSSNIDSIGESRILVADMMIALSNVRDLYLVSRGLFTNINHQTLRTQIQVALDAAKTTKETLEQSKSTLSQEHIDLYNSPRVKLLNYRDNPTTKGLIQATEDVITKGLNLAKTDLASIGPNNSDYYFVTYNLFNDYYMGLLKSSELYVSEFFSNANASTSTFTMIMILSIVALVVSMLLLIPIILSVTRAQDQVLRLFLDIPDKTVKSLYSKCENFVSNLQVGEEEELVSEMDDEEIDKGAEDQEAQGWLARKRRKKFKNTRRSHRSFFLVYLVLGVLVESPFVYNYRASDQMFQDAVEVAIEFNSTSFAELFYSFANNAQRQLFIDPSVPILNQQSADVVVNDIEMMRILNSDILSNNSVNIEKHTTEYNNIFFQIFYGDPCPLFTNDVAFATCEAFANQTVPRGISLLLVRHFENMNLLLDTYLDLNSGGAWPFDPSYIQPNVDSNTTRNQMLSLMRVPRALEIATTQSVYIKSAFRMLITSFEENMKEDFDSFKTVRLLIFTFFIVLVGIIYIFIWIPLVSRMSNKIWKTKSMLNMIPIGIIVKIKTIRTYLRNCLNENHLHNY